MPRYRVCRTFTVESGHMLSKHPEACRYPHGHTRRIEVVVAADELDARDMVCDFKAIKLLAADYIDRLDHAMAINSADPLLPAMSQIHPNGIVVFEGRDPTTEVLARDLYDFISCALQEGFEADGYRIDAGRVTLERVRVWETPHSWAEYGA